MLASSPNITHSAEKSLHCFACITASLSEERAEGWRVVWVDPGPPLSPQCAWVFKEPRPPAPPPRRGSASVEGCAQHLTEKAAPPRTHSACSFHWNSSYLSGTAFQIARYLPDSEAEPKRRTIMRSLSRLMIAAGFIGTIAATGTTAAVAQGVYLQGPGFGVDIGRPAYRERHYYRGYSDYDSPRIYSGRRYNRGPDVYERHSYRRGYRDWD